MNKSWGLKKQSRVLSLVKWEIIELIKRFGWIVRPEGRKAFKEYTSLFLRIENPLKLLKDPLWRSERFQAKYREEKTHYLMLEASLKHKRNEVGYFHKEKGEETRKWIIFSLEECISSIHIIKRKEQTSAIVYMRSSDAINLLPVDILGIIKILSRLYSTINKEKLVLEIFIGSSHIYLEDL